MLLALLSALTLLPSPSHPTSRYLAAAQLEAALERCATADGTTLQLLRSGIEAARKTLGPDSEVAAELDRLDRDARLEGVSAEDGGASWLAGQLTRVVSDLRFEPLREADLPADFPDETPVGEIQVQQYPAYRAARKEIRDASLQGAFWALFRHIRQGDIAMTAPVETTFEAYETAMTESSMAFLYASMDLGSTGAQGTVEVIDVAAHSAVSLGLRGVENPERIESARRRLERWIDERPQWRRSGPLRTMGYNSPMVRGDRRYFEVQIPVHRATEMVIDFTDAHEASRWREVDDVVMGGRSSSQMLRSSEETALFTGELSLANNGGFASVRTTGERCSLTGAGAVILSVRGDGKAYRLRCLVATERGEISYQAPFQTRAGEWIDVALHLADFEPRWRGRLITDAPALDATAVRGLGLMIADGQQGDFRLELRSLAKVLRPAAR